MKKLYILTLLSILLFNNGCNDSKLDILPLNILTSDQVFQSESAINAYMSAMYAVLPFEDFVFFPGRNGNPLANSTDESINCFGDEPSGISGGTWTQWWGYGYIRNVNDFIAKVPAANLSTSKINVLLGEAKFIRAFYYFGLVKRYGGVPIIKEVQIFKGDNMAELQVPRNTEKEVWDFVASDLDEAANLLPETNVSGRATKYVALALKSRAMLYAASVAKYGSVMLGGIVGISSSEANKYWQAAYDAAKLVINSGKHSLYKKNTNKELNFQQLFIESSNPEAIFSENYYYPNKTHGYDSWFLPYGVRGPDGYSSRMGPTLELVEQYEYVDGTSGALKIANSDGTPIFYTNPTDIFKDKDPRCMGTVIIPFGKYKSSIIDVQAGIYDRGIKTEAGDFSALYNPNTHKPDNVNGTIHIVGLSGFGGSEKTQTGFYVRKYLNYNMDQSQAKQWGCYQAWIELRYGEVLLNYAEAAIELNNVSDAKWAMNEIRDRAGIKLLNDNEVTIDRVRHERLVELAFENHRWWDYRRWRISDKILNNSRFHALKPYYDIQANAYRFETGLAGRYYKTFDVKVYYERIDPGEIAKNPKLIQNPNY